MESRNFLDYGNVYFLEEMKPRTPYNLNNDANEHYLVAQLTFTVTSVAFLAFVYSLL